MSIKIPYNDYVKLMYFKNNIAPNTGFSYSEFKQSVSDVVSFKRSNFKAVVDNTLSYTRPDIPLKTPHVDFLSSSELSRLGIALLSGNSLLLLIVALSSNVMSSFNSIYGESIRSGNLDTFVSLVNSLDGAIFWPKMVNTIFQFFTNIFNWIFEYLLRFLNWLTNFFV